MKLLSLIFLSVFLVSCSSSDRKISCTAWEHPSSGFFHSGLVSVGVLSINENARVLLSEENETQIKPAWSENRLKANGFVGKELGVSKLRIPEAGDYIVWVSKKAFVSVATEEDATPLAKARDAFSAAETRAKHMAVAAVRAKATADISEAENAVDGELDPGATARAKAIEMASAKAERAANAAAELEAVVEDKKPESLPSKRYIEACEEQAENKGFLRAVEFSFEKGVYHIQFSHTEGFSLMYHVTKSSDQN